LGIAIHEQALDFGRSKGCRKVDGGSCLAYPTLLVGDGDNMAHARMLGRKAFLMNLSEQTIFCNAANWCMFHVERGATSGGVPRGT
jgi:hypothetical protein